MKFPAMLFASRWRPAAAADSPYLRSCSRGDAHRPRGCHFQAAGTVAKLIGGIVPGSLQAGASLKGNGLPVNAD